MKRYPNAMGLRRDDHAIWRAQLTEMPLSVILAYLRERGVLSGAYCRLDALPPGEPPRSGDDEVLPFDANTEIVRDHDNQPA